MPSYQNAKSTKCHVSKVLRWQKIYWSFDKLEECLDDMNFDQLPSWQNVILTKCHLDKMSSWQNVILTKCHLDKMSSWQNVILTKCQFDKMSTQQNTKLTKCQVDKMSHPQKPLCRFCSLAAFPISLAGFWLLCQTQWSTSTVQGTNIINYFGL